MMPFPAETCHTRPAEVAPVESPAVRGWRHGGLIALAVARASTCIDQNNPRCHCRQRHPSKSESKAMVAARLRYSSDESLPVGPAEVLIDVNMGAASPSRGRSAPSLSSVLSLKRCRLSPSPATGLVGMQENAFLNDYFGCLGFLPLASASVARQAMVNIMIDSKEQQRQGRVFTGAGGAARRKQRGDPRRGQKGGWGQALAYQDPAGSCSKCIFWSAVALGALLQGCSLSFVTGYAKLAQDSLAECFDGTSVETARAYIVMACLCKFLGDQIKNDEYIAFASSIVDRLPKEVVPSDMENLLLALRQESEVVNYGCRGSDAPVTSRAEAEGTDRPSSANGRIVHEKELCNILLMADRRMTEEIVEDMGSDGFLATFEGEVQETPEGGGGVDGDSERFEEQLEWAKMSGAEEWAGCGLGAGLKSSVGVRDWGTNRGGGVTPPIRAATLTFVNDVLPELERVSSVIERSGTCSGVGGIFYHSVMAYANLIKGERKCAFQAILACTRVMVEYPGMCRFRPHMVHCVLLAAASTMCPVVYAPMKEVYNSILPENGPRAPPLEEWSGMSCICNHVFCRSFEITTNHVGFGPRNLGVSRERATGVGTPPAPWLGLPFSPITEGTHGSHMCLACGAHAAPSASSSLRTAPTVLVSPRLANEMQLSSPTHAQASWQQMIDTAADGEVGTDSMAAVIPVVSLEAQRLCDGEESCGTGEVGAGCGLRAEEPDPKSEMVHVGLLDGFFPGGQSESKPETPNNPAVARADPAVVPVSDGAWCDRGVGNVEAPNRADLVAESSDLTWCGDLSLFDEEREGDGLCLTEDYLMEAAEALMSSPPLDEQLGGEETVDLV